VPPAARCSTCPARRGGQAQRRARAAVDRGAGKLMRTYVNSVPTAMAHARRRPAQRDRQGGPQLHRTHKLEPKGVTLSAEDIREGVVAVLSTYVHDPQFQGQTKTGSTTPRSRRRSRVSCARRSRTTSTATRTGAGRRRAVDHLGARPRGVARGAGRSRAVRRLAPAHLPGKLADCSSTNPGDSSCSSSRASPQVARQAGPRSQDAGDPAAQGQDPQRGAANNQKLLANKELQDIVSALGCGMGDELDLGKLRYDKIFLLMDATPTAITSRRSC